MQKSRVNLLSFKYIGKKARPESSDQELQAMEVQDIKSFVYIHICSKIMNIHLPQCVGTVETIFKICTQM